MFVCVLQWSFPCGGARVIMGCRNMELCEIVCASIIEETCNRNVICRKLDLASLASVREFADSINSSKYVCLFVLSAIVPLIRITIINKQTVKSTIHQTTMTSFAITLYGQCFRRHLVGQWIVSVVCKVSKVIRHLYVTFCEMNSLLKCSHMARVKFHQLGLET